MLHRIFLNEVKRCVEQCDVILQTSGQFVFVSKLLGFSLELMFDRILCLRRLLRPRMVVSELLTHLAEEAVLKSL